MVKYYKQWMNDSFMDTFILKQQKNLHTPKIYYLSFTLYQEIFDKINKLTTPVSLRVQIKYLKNLQHSPSTIAVRWKEPVQTALIHQRHLSLCLTIPLWMAYFCMPCKTVMSHICKRQETPKELLLCFRNIRIWLVNCFINLICIS